MLPLLVYLGPIARANTVYFATNPQNLTVSSTTWGVNSTATFDINSLTNTIVVHLNNLLTNPTDVDQLLGSVRFSISGRGLSGTNISATENSTDTELDVGSSEFPKNVGNITDGIWGASASGSSTQLNVTLCAVCSNGGTNGLIIGSPAIGGKYTNADATLKSGTTAQWILGSGLTYTGGALNGRDSTADFTLTFPSITALGTVTITNVIFGFGESPNYGWDIYTVPIENPEPESVILFGTGLALVAAGTWRRRRRSKP